MYSQLEKMTIAYLNTINQLKAVCKNTDLHHKLELIIKESIENISLNGGKIRLVENDILTLIDINEKYTMCSKL
tara:strand:- start:484 stop:705 length:222 start_codon:yes stop_codon:yes gene_type:complete